MAYRLGDGAVIDRAGEHRWAGPVAAPPLVPAQPRERAPRSGNPEIDCIRHLVPPAILAVAEQRAAEADVGADRVLIAWGVVSEEAYVTALAASLGMPLEPLSRAARWQCPLSEPALVEAANTGMMPLMGRDELCFVVAPRLIDSRRLMEPLCATGSASAVRTLAGAVPLRFRARHVGRGGRHRLR